MTDAMRTMLAARLRERGLRATPQRIELLSALTSMKGPAGIPELMARARKGSMDTATLYRGLESLTKAGLARRVDLRHGHTDYELAEDGEHHHHIVCTGCGRVAEFDWCPDARVERGILERAQGFARLDEHALEFFGRCTRCA